MKYNKEDVKLHIEESGCIRSYWAAMPGQPQRRVGDIDRTTKEKAIDNAISEAMYADKRDKLETELRAECPEQPIYQAYLYNDITIDDIALPTEGIGNYLYVYPSRRKKGIYHLKNYRFIG